MEKSWWGRMPPVYAHCISFPKVFGKKDSIVNTLKKAEQEGVFREWRKWLSDPWNQNKVSGSRHFTSFFKGGGVMTSHTLLPLHCWCFCLVLSSPPHRSLQRKCYTTIEITMASTRGKTKEKRNGQTYFWCCVVLSLPVSGPSRKGKTLFYLERLPSTLGWRHRLCDERTTTQHYIIPSASGSELLTLSCLCRMRTVGFQSGHTACNNVRNPF